MAKRKHLQVTLKFPYEDINGRTRGHIKVTATLPAKVARQLEHLAFQSFLRFPSVKIGNEVEFYG